MSDPFIRTRMLIGDEPLSRLAAAKVAQKSMSSADDQALVDAFLAEVGEQV